MSYRRANPWRPTPSGRLLQTTSERDGELEEAEPFALAAPAPVLEHVLVGADRLEAVTGGVAHVAHVDVPAVVAPRVHVDDQVPADAVERPEDLPNLRRRVVLQGVVAEHDVKGGPVHQRRELDRPRQVRLQEGSHLDVAPARLPRLPPLLGEPHGRAGDVDALVLEPGGLRQGRVQALQAGGHPEPVAARGVQ
eukprot:CAMPEP_0179260594 /NCGR_PEP_ID=MMETSP0797-20121207/26418_1 /TAXON_ID=47934 /ORGANISM="Dinophysis acuminata, Strain DAEP01" /LENGTH=193 /DNA_ID=CAMNT_0020968675 /DNA_START=97 /DNA_END=674 /DNA_ORIENTATION=+